MDEDTDLKALGAAAANVDSAASRPTQTMDMSISQTSTVSNGPFVHSLNGKERIEENGRTVPSAQFAVTSLHPAHNAVSASEDKADYHSLTLLSPPPRPVKYSPTPLSPPPKHVKSTSSQSLNPRQFNPLPNGNHHQHQQEPAETQFSPDTGLHTMRPVSDIQEHQEPNQSLGIPTYSPLAAEGNFIHRTQSPSASVVLNGNTRDGALNSRNEETQMGASTLKQRGSENVKQREIKNSKLSEAMKAAWARRKRRRFNEHASESPHKNRNPAIRTASRYQHVSLSVDQSHRLPRHVRDLNAQTFTDMGMDAESEYSQDQTSTFVASSSNDKPRTDVCRKIVLPVLVSLESRHRDKAPESVLISICKSVADEIVNPRFVAFLRQSDFQLNERQVKLIKRSIKDSFARRLKRLGGLYDRKVTDDFLEHSKEKVNHESLTSDENRSTVSENKSPDISTDVIEPERPRNKAACLRCRIKHLKCVAVTDKCIQCGKLGKSCSLSGTRKQSAAVKDSCLTDSGSLLNIQHVRRSSHDFDITKSEAAKADVGTPSKRCGQIALSLVDGESKYSSAPYQDNESVAELNTFPPTQEELWNYYRFHDSSTPLNSTPSPSHEARDQSEDNVKDIEVPINVDSLARPTALLESGVSSKSLVLPCISSPRNRLTIQDCASKDYTLAVRKGLFSTLQKPTYPTAFDPKLERLLANAALCSQTRPYKHPYHGHVDFVQEECVALLTALDKIENVDRLSVSSNYSQIRQELAGRLHLCPENKITSLILAVHADPKSVLRYRKKKNIRAFLHDLVHQAQNNILSNLPPRLLTVRTADLGQGSSTAKSMTSLLRHREVADSSSSVSYKPIRGLPHHRNTDLFGSLALRVAESITPWRSWNDACGDVVACAWSPDSKAFAAGAAAHTDEQDLQYNRGNNLLFGELERNIINELPDHCVPRPMPDTIANGPNANPDTYNACDPMIYTTVTAVQFSPTGECLYTASNDKTVKVWDTETGYDKAPKCVNTLHHKAEVTSLEVSSLHPGHFATASKQIEGAIRAYYRDQQSSANRLKYTEFSSPRAVQHRNLRIYPECIRWGLTPKTKNYLLAGFQQWAEHNLSAKKQGHVCLWDVATGESLRVSPNSSSVFSAAFHPLDDLFVTGGAPSGGSLSYRDTRSVVRLYDIRNTNFFQAELESPSLDIQDVTFHPVCSSYVAAGYTDGTTYVWDRRNPDNVLHHLKHGDSLQPLPCDQPREVCDAGVMLNLWGVGGSRFYTGSSDGVIKAWDIRRASEDTWIKDVARLPAGVQSGALSKDGMNMVVGDAVGGVHVLSASPCGPRLEDDGATLPMTFVPAKGNVKLKDDNPGTEGIAAAQVLLDSDKVCVTKRFGAVRGPYYHSLYSGGFHVKSNDPREVLMMERRETLSARQAPDLYSTLWSKPGAPSASTLGPLPISESASSNPKVTNLDTRTAPKSTNQRLKRVCEPVAASERCSQRIKIIDLTCSDEEDAISTPPPPNRTNRLLKLEMSREAIVKDEHPPEYGGEARLGRDEKHVEGVDDDVISYEEWIKEDFWWPEGC